MIKRGEFPKNVPADIKVTGFTPAEDEIIRDNWKRLLSEVNLDKKEEQILQEMFASYRREEVFEMKKNIVGFFLSQNLPEVRLATEVQHRAKLLLWRRTGRFTPEEDQRIIDFANKQGDDAKPRWGKLARHMRRQDANKVKTRYELLISYKKDIISGVYTADEDKKILIEVFKVNKKAVRMESFH